MDQPSLSGKILVVDDNEEIRMLLRANLELFGHTIFEAVNGRQAIDMIRSQDYDLVLLDIMMPEMNGYDVLEFCRNDPQLSHLPIVVVSAIQDMNSVVRCIEMGANDYLPKPFKTTLLRARVDALLEQKRLRDQEQAYLRVIDEERHKSEHLLFNILPAPIAARIKAGEAIIADNCPDVTVLFADLVDFTEYAGSARAADVVSSLNNIVIIFDDLVEKLGVEKIKTTGDAYMAVGGINIPRPDHAEACAELALAMIKATQELHFIKGKAVKMRVGMHCGPVVAGVIGKSKFIYDLWGDTVNIASRMEELDPPGSIQVSTPLYERLKYRYEFQPRGMIDVKGKGSMQTYLLLGRK